MDNIESFTGDLQMHYQKELDFFIKLAERLKIQTTLISSNELPAKIDMGIRDFLNLESDYKRLFDFNVEKNTVYKITDPFYCNYIFIPLHQENKTLIIGPYTNRMISPDSITEKSKIYGFSKSTEKQIMNYFSTIPYLSDDSMLIMVTNCFCEVLFGTLDSFKIVTKNISEISDTSIFTRSVEFNKSDDPWMTIQLLERRYNAENALIDAVSQGLYHKAEMMFSNITPSKALETRLDDPIRNAKNFMIILNTLLRKAAEKGSVHILYIDSVSSDFAQKIETTKSLAEIDELFYYMIKRYCRLVNKHSQKNYSLLIQKAILHIDADITADLSLKNLANILGVNPSYLSTLFKKEVGLPLTEYVNKQRTEKAKQLLKATNLQIQQVAQNCGILDVNYFTKIFKKYTGTTPNKYRKS